MTKKRTENPSKEYSEGLQLLEPDRDTRTTPPALRPIRVRDGRSAKKLLARLIAQLQSGAVSNATAKDMAYLLSVYVQIHQTVELEERLRRLEAHGASKSS